MVYGIVSVAVEAVTSHVAPNARTMTLRAYHLRPKTLLLDKTRNYVC